jgi:hypothetical protein
MKLKTHDFIFNRKEREETRRFRKDISEFILRNRLRELNYKKRSTD